MSNKLKIYKWWIINKKDNDFLMSLMQELEEWKNKISAKEIADTIKSLLNAKTYNNAWIEIYDHKTRLDTVKLLLQLNWVKTSNSVNINLFNINKPWKDDILEY